MIVADASVLLEVLLGTAAAAGLRERLLQGTESLHAPHLVDLEIAQVLRRYCLAGEVKAWRAAEALEDLTDLPLARYSHRPFLSRIWELRGGITAYDAAYVALAEALNAPLLTRDRRLASARGHRAKIELV
jgi:predicted nucleic acid-binding protein